MLLLHPQSGKLFAREIHMNVLLDLLDAGNSAAVQSATLLTLVCALIEHPANTRVRFFQDRALLHDLTARQVFEALDGLATVTSLFKRRDTPRGVKLKILEFLYFYLMPETPTAGLAPPAPATPPKGKNPATKNRDLRIDRTTEEKQSMLGEFMSNVEGLVADLRESQPFGM
jgi:hypothetical protein